MLQKAFPPVRDDMLLRGTGWVRRGGGEEHPTSIKNYEGYLDQRNRRHYRMVVSDEGKLRVL